MICFQKEYFFYKKHYNAPNGNTDDQCSLCDGTQRGFYKIIRTRKFGCIYKKTVQYTFQGITFNHSKFRVEIFIRTQKNSFWWIQKTYL